MSSIRWHLMLATPLLLWSSSPSPAQIRIHDRYVLSSTEVSRTIVAAFSTFSPGTPEPIVLLLADVTANEASPQLEVDRASMLMLPSDTRSGDRRAVRVRCRKISSCLPFYAVVTWPRGAAPEQRLPPLHEAPLLMVHQGAHMTLILSSAGTRLEVPVVTLQSGAAGTCVRAISLDRRHIYTARVYSESVLKGDL